MLTLTVLFIATVISAVSGQTPQSYGSCTTPEGKRGKCISLSECTEIYNLFLIRGQTSAESMHLRSTQCGAKNRIILVCCSEDQIQVRSDELVELPSPAKRECGRVLQDRIVGGNATKFDQYPWTALLEYEKYGQSIGHKCGGSLINKRYVLTAAHCLNNRKPVRVRLGEWDTSTSVDCVTNWNGGRKDCADPHLDVGVESSRIHPNYKTKSKSQHNDIALIRLDRDIEPTFFIQPICLPPESAVERDAQSGKTMTVAGWGRTENSTKSAKKLKLEIEVVSNSDCQNIYRSYTVNLISTQLCAGGVKGKDSCSGDSGGPLMAVDRINNKDYTYLAGVLSFGQSPCGREGWPGVYTKVSEFKNWILDNMIP